MFHRVHRQGTAPWGQGSISDVEFEELLHFVGVKNILPPEEWISRLKINKLRDQDLCLTFDDGLKCQYDVCLPLLEKYRLRGFWFIYSSVFEGTGGELEIYSCFATRYFENIDAFYEVFFSKCGPQITEEFRESKFKKYARVTQSSFRFYSSNDLKFRFVRNELQPKFEKIMDQMIREKEVSKNEISKNLWFSNSELKALSDKGHFVGLHSYSHPPNLSKLSDKDQFRQYRKNEKHIREVCKIRVVSMAHPLNSYKEGTLRLLRGLGILCGFRSNAIPPDGKKINPNSLELAREDAANILRKMKTSEVNRLKDVKAYASWD